MPQPKARTVTDLEYELREARDRLAQGERSLLSARAKLEVFAARYQRTVGERFEHLRKLQSLRGPAAAEPLATRLAHPARPPGNAEFDRLYRDLARRVHPDLSDDPSERAIRTRAMAELNAARETLDFARARRLGDTFAGGAEETAADDTMDQLDRLLIAIERVEARLTAVTADAVRLRENKLYLLMEVVEAQERSGIDVLGETAADLDSQIAAARAALPIGREAADATRLTTRTAARAAGAASAEPLDVDVAPDRSFARLATALALTGGIALVAASLAASRPSGAPIITTPSADARPTQAVAAVETTPAPHAYRAIEREQSASGRTTATVRVVIEGAPTLAEKVATLAEAARRELRSQQAVVVFAYASPGEIGGPFTIGRAYLSVDGKGWSGDGQTPDGPDGGRVVGSVVVAVGATPQTRTFSAPR